MKEYPKWPFHNCDPNEGSYLNYLQSKPKSIGLSTYKYYPNTIDDIRSGIVYIDNNILSIQYEHSLIGDFYEISLMKYDISQKNKLNKIFGDYKNGKIRYLNKKDIFNFIRK